MQSGSRDECPYSIELCLSCPWLWSAPHHALSPGTGGEGVVRGDLNLEASPGRKERLGKILLNLGWEIDRII
jgi:hypothetical protein